MSQCAQLNKLFLIIYYYNNKLGLDINPTFMLLRITKVSLLASYDISEALRVGKLPQVVVLLMLIYLQLPK